MQGRPAHDRRTRTRSSRASSSPPTPSAATTPSSTSAARSCTSTGACWPPSRRRARPGSSGRTWPGAGSTSRSRCTRARARTSVARRRPCSTRSRGAADSRGSSRRSPPSRVSTPGRPSSTTWRASPPSPRSCGRGADWFTSMGTARSTGFGFFSLSGHVTRPGQYEAPLGITLRELLDMAGGIRAGHELKFWTPGGSSTPILTAEHLDVPLDYEAVAGAGSMLAHAGAAGVRRDHVGGPVRHPVDRLLRARVLRQVHAVPRGDLLAQAGAPPARGGQGHRGRRRPPPRTSRRTSSAGPSARSATPRRRR